MTAQASGPERSFFHFSRIHEVSIDACGHRRDFFSEQFAQKDGGQRSDNFFRCPLKQIAEPDKKFSVPESYRVVDSNKLVKIDMKDR